MSEPLRRRPEPSRTIDGLRPPQADFAYFSAAARFPFDLRVPRVGPAEATWLADAALLAYGTADFIEREFGRSPLPAQGHTLEWLGHREDNRGFVLSHDRTRVIVFRGTRLEVHSLLDAVQLVLINQADFVTDSQFVPRRFDRGGNVHAGFFQAFREMIPILDELAADREIWLAGHSLGAALATLAASHLGPDRVRGLVTFGAPRVGDAPFVATLPTREHLRYVHGEDLITAQPPEFLGYRHGGALVELPGPTREPPLDLWRSDVTRFLQVVTNGTRGQKLNLGDLPFTVLGLADHAPAYYATTLYNALLDASQPGVDPIESNSEDSRTPS